MNVQKIFTRILEGNMPDSEIQEFLLELKKQGETSEDITYAAQALLDVATPFPKPDYLFADLVGTGGDEQGTYNISTAATLVAAAMGLPMAKHGNRSVSSRCGSADVLISLGANLEMSPEQSRACLDRTGFCFLLAPVYHPGMRHAMKVRRALHTRTIFNLLGPLVNPAHPSVQLTGVYDPKWCRPVAETLQKLGAQRTLVVHGSGLDEIAIHGPTQGALLNDGVIEEFVWEPFQSYSLDSIKGGEPDQNAEWLVKLLKGQASDAQVEAVAVNAGSLLWLAGDKISDISARKLACEQARDLIQSGKAYDTLDAFISYSRIQTA